MKLGKKLMTIRGMGRLRRCGRRALSLVQPRAVILLYHRIVELPVDPHQLCVTPARFAEQVDHLSRHYRVMTLRELGRALRGGELPRRAVALTFDDGYADNLYQARPLLERAGVPATCFVASGYIGADRLFWWDDLELLLLRSPALPDTLAVTLHGCCHSWQLGAAGEKAPGSRLPAPGSAGREPVPSEPGTGHRAPGTFSPSWHMGSRDCPTPRHQAYRDLWHLLQPLPHAERETALASLWAQAGEGRSPNAEHRVMTADEVRRLAEGGLVEIGAHTVTHPVLADLSPLAQQAEICRSKSALEELLGRPVTAFSYPFGGEDAVGADAPGLARRAGFETACIVSSRPVSRGGDPYRLPRCWVGDWDGDTFARHLRTFFAS